MKGHSLCGTHARAKSVDIWNNVSETAGQVVLCQSLARRWLVRRHLQLAGPGVLCRKDVANSEELVSYTEASRQHPLEYFAFEENNKVWWFDFGSIWVWSLKSVTPSNPYTRCPLTTDVRKRLRDMWALRVNRKLTIPADPEPGDERIRQRWIMLCQTFVDNGFTDVSLEQLLRIGKASHIAMWRFLQGDCPVAKGLCDYMLSSRLLASNAPTYIINSLRLLMRLVTLQKEPYGTIFNVMSAVYRC